MAWFSVWLPLLLQFAVPVALLWGLRRAAHSRATFVLAAAAVAAYVAAIALIGIWLVLPWYTPVWYGLLWLLLVVSSWGRAKAAPLWPVTLGGRAAMLVAAMAAAAALAGIAVALGARRVPPDPVDLAMPLREGTYLVVNGGGHILVNAHLNTLTRERLARYRGQSHGVDLVRVNALGLRAASLLPPDPAAYAIFGDPVVAPCAGSVVSIEDGLPDLPPPQTDREHPAGNHVILDCGGNWIVLGHLQRGSVAVRPGRQVVAGTRLGRVGNSGNTGEPHLHLHAQRPGSAAMPLGGEPLPIRLNGRVVARNDRLAD